MAPFPPSLCVGVNACVEIIIPCGSACCVRRRLRRWREIAVETLRWFNVEVMQTPTRTPTPLVETGPKGWGRALCDHRSVRCRRLTTWPADQYQIYQQVLKCVKSPPLMSRKSLVLPARRWYIEFKKAACSFRMFERSCLRQPRLFRFIRHYWLAVVHRGVMKGWNGDGGERVRRGRTVMEGWNGNEGGREQWWGGQGTVVEGVGQWWRGWNSDGEQWWRWNSDGGVERWWRGGTVMEGWNGDGGVERRWRGGTVMEGWNGDGGVERWWRGGTVTEATGMVWKGAAENFARLEGGGWKYFHTFIISLFIYIDFSLSGIDSWDKAQCLLWHDNHSFMWWYKKCFRWNYWKSSEWGDV